MSATMILDYTNADIWVEDANGDLVQVDNVVDEDDNPLTLVEVTVQLEDRNRLLIAPGVPAHLQLDFDLKATNTVTFNGLGIPTVRVDPYLVADVNCTDWKTRRLRGLLDAVDPVAQLNMDVQSINHCRVDVYDFSGTGVDAGSDADPGSYDINTATLDLSNMGTGDPVKALGFVQPFGAAPQDFNAHSLVNVADVRAFLKVKWEPESATAFAQLSAQGIMLDLAGADHPHHLFRGWVFTDLSVLGQPTTVAPQADGQGVFVLHCGGVIQVLLTFEDYIDELQDRLDDGWLVHKIRARGDFDDASAMLTADLVDVQLQ